MRLEEGIGLSDAPARRRIADVGDDAGYLIDRADLGRAHALSRGENRIEKGDVRKEDAGSRAGEEHHPQHRVAEHDPEAVRIVADDTAAARHEEGPDEHDSDGRERDLVDDFVLGGEAPDRLTGIEEAEIERSQQTGCRKQQPTDDDARDTAGDATDHTAMGSFRAPGGETGGKTLTDQPGNDQHHALDAEGDQER